MSARGRVVVRLPTELVARYRAVDRELVGSALCDTPQHLDALAESIRAHGIQVPLCLGFNFGISEGSLLVRAALMCRYDPSARHQQPVHPPG